MNRSANTWEVSLQRQDGEVVAHQVKAHWDKDYKGVEEVVARTAAAEAWYASGKKFEFAPISVKGLS